MPRMISSYFLFWQLLMRNTWLLQKLCTKFPAVLIDVTHGNSTGDITRTKLSVSNLLLPNCWTNSVTNFVVSFSQFLSKWEQTYFEFFCNINRHFAEFLWIFFRNNCYWWEANQILVFVLTKTIDQSNFLRFKGQEFDYFFKIHLRLEI